eukprot:6410960-Amphidinium_carterae.1
MASCCCSLVTSRSLKLAPADSLSLLDSMVANAKLAKLEATNMAAIKAKLGGRLDWQLLVLEQIEGYEQEEKGEKPVSRKRS